MTREINCTLLRSVLVQVMLLNSSKTLIITGFVDYVHRPEF
jgi:hypothetical protein